MEGKRLIRTLQLQNFLSFGSESEEMTLEPLNVLIGPNASGKSNLIEAIGILRATPKDLAAPIREGGGISEWLWKGGKAKPTATLEVTVYYPEGIMPLRYRVCFTTVGQRLELVDEVVENERPSSGADDVYFFYRYQKGRPAVNVRNVSTVSEIQSTAGIRTWEELDGFCVGKTSAQSNQYCLSGKTQTYIQRSHTWETSLPIYDYTESGI